MPLSVERVSHAVGISQVETTNSLGRGVLVPLLCGQTRLHLTVVVQQGSPRDPPPAQAILTRANHLNQLTPGIGGELSESRSVVTRSTSDGLFVQLSWNV